MTTTTFALLIQHCGLSQREAAEFLSVRLDTIKSWSIGRNPTPDGVIGELRTLHSKIECATREAIDQIDSHALKNGMPDAIELGLASDDYEAQTLGWPCVGAHAAMLGLVVAKSSYRFSVSPRGSTLASAAQGHEKK